MSDVIETSGSEVKEPVADETADAAPGPETPRNGQATTTTASEPVVETPKAAPEKKSEEPSEEVVNATVAMAQAAAKSPEDALMEARGMKRELLLETLSKQIPAEWLSPDVHETLRKMETEALATFLSWLSLSWWQGYEHGRVETVNALQKAADSGHMSDSDKAALGRVKDDIRQEQKTLSEAIVEAGKSPNGDREEG